MVRKELFAKTGDEAELIDNALTDFIQVSEINPLDETAKLILEGLSKGERLWTFTGTFMSTAGGASSVATGNTNMQFEAKARKSWSRSGCWIKL